MSTYEVHARLDDFARRLRQMERELGELRLATQPAPTPAPASVAPPPARRAAPLPPARPRPRKPRRELPRIDPEMLFGARSLAWTGGFVTILGVLFFFVLAVDRGWIGPIARVSLGAMASALVFGGGLWLHRRYGDTYAASSAVAAGIAGGFATLLFASARYDLLPDPAALAIAGLFAAVATATALAWGTQTIAGLGLVGAMLVPLAAAVDEPHHLTIVGTWFAVVTLAATAVVALRRGWLPLLAAAAAALVPQVLVLARQDDGAAPVAAAAWLLMLGIAVVAQRANREALDRLPAGFVTASTAMAALATGQLFDGRREGLVLLAIAIVELVAAAALYRALPELAALLGVAGLTVGAVAASDLLSGATLATAWAAEAAVLAWLSPRLRDARLTLASMTFLTAAAVHALVVDAPLRVLLTEVPHPAAGALALLAVAAAAVVTAVYARPWRGPEPRYAGLLAFLDEPAAGAVSIWRERRIVALWSAGTLVLYAAALGLVAVVGFGWGHVTVRGLLAVTAVALVVFAGPGWRRHLGWAGHLVVLAGVAINPRLDALTTDQLGWGAAIMGAGALAVVLIDELRRYDEPVARFVAPVYALGSTVLAVIGTWLLVEPHTARDVALLGVAALYAGLGALVGWRGRRGTSTALWAPAIVVALYAAAALLDGSALVIVIAAGSAAAVTIAEVVGERRLQFAAAALLATGLAHVLVVDAPPREFFSANASPAGGVIAIAFLAAAAVVFAVTRFAPPEGERPALPWDELAWELDGKQEQWRHVAGGMAALLGLYGLSLAILGAFEWIGHAGVATSFQRGHTAVSAVWGLLGLLLLVAGLARRLPWLRTAGFALLGVSVAKLFLYDLSALSSVTRALSFLAVGAVLLLGGFLYQRLARNGDGGPLPAH
jgi:uncharacterized membrane protein